MGSPTMLNRRPSVSLPTGTGYGLAGVDRLGAATQAVGGAHGQTAHPVVAQVLLHLSDELLAAHLDLDGIVDLREFVGWELHVDDSADDLHYLPR